MVWYIIEKKKVYEGTSEKMAREYLKKLKSTKRVQYELVEIYGKN